MNNQHRKILTKARKLQNLCGDSAITNDSIKNVEKELDIIFSEDFKKFCTIYGYDYCKSFEFFRFGKEVIDTTKEWRANINFPDNYLVLSDDGTSAVIMELEGNNSRVIWCSLEDILRLCDGEKMVYNPHIFNSFIDFFEYLLDQEEEIREILS